MAGRPLLRALKLTLAEAASAAGFPTAEEYFFARVANGERITAICKDLKVSRDLLYDWIRNDDRRQVALREARKVSADALADQALDIVDNANPETIGVAREQARYRQWLAQSFHRELYAPNAPGSPGLTINVGTLHLEALRAIQTPAVPAVIEPAQLVASEPDDGSAVADGTDCPRDTTDAPPASSPERTPICPRDFV